MASELLKDLKTVPTEVKRSQIEGAVGSSWAALAAEEDPQRRGIWTSLVEAGAGRGGGQGGGDGREGGGGRGREGAGGGDRCIKRREQWESPSTTQPDRENEPSQTNRGVGGVYVEVVPRVHSKLSRALHAHPGKKLLLDLQNLESTTIKRAMVRFRGAREKGAMALVEYLGISQEDTMEDSLWRETVGRSLGSHDTVELVGGMCHGNGCRQETTRLHAISYTKTRWSSLTHNQVLHQALARSLRKSKVQFVIENTWAFRERASGQNGRLNDLRIDVTKEAGDSSTTTLGARKRRLYSALPLSILAPAPIWRMQHAMQENISPTQSSGKKQVSELVHRHLLLPSSRYVDGDGGGKGAGTRTEVEANKGTQDGSGAGRGDGAGTETEMGVEARGQTQDGDGDGSGDGNENSSGDGNGDEDGNGGRERGRDLGGRRGGEEAHEAAQELKTRGTLGWKEKKNVDKEGLVQ